VTADEIVERLRPEAEKLSGFERITFNVEAGGPPVGAPVNIRIIGPDARMRAALTDAVVDELATLDGVKDIDRNDTAGKPEVKIDLDYDRLPRLGLTVADVSAAARIAFDGEVVTSVRYGDEDVAFRVVLSEQARSDPKTLERLRITNRDGRLISLGALARFRDGPGPSNIYHFDSLRATTVTADIDRDKMTPLEATAAVTGAFDLNRDWPGLRFVVGGEAEETAKSFQSLGIAFVIALIGIFFVLVLLFDSVTQPFLVLIAIPFGIVGVIIAFAIHSEPLGFLAMMGLVGLTGVAICASSARTTRCSSSLPKARPTGCVPF
jgi:multidrug efflux pump subunit AcrB